MGVYFAKAPHKLGRHVPGSSGTRNFRSPPSHAVTNSIHDHGAGVEGSEKLDQLLAAHLLAKHGFAVPVLAVKVKRMLAQIVPNQRNVLHDGLSGKENTLQRNPRVGWG
jgi:hypothetical protein